MGRADDALPVMIWTDALGGETLGFHKNSLIIGDEQEVSSGRESRGRPGEQDDQSDGARSRGKTRTHGEILSSKFRVAVIMPLAGDPLNRSVSHDFHSSALPFRRTTRRATGSGAQNERSGDTDPVSVLLGG
jgi:hypothetical protein